MDVALVQQHRKIPAHFQHPKTQTAKYRFLSPHGQMFQTVQEDSKFCQHLFLFPGFTLSSGPPESLVVLCLNQWDQYQWDQTFWLHLNCTSHPASLPNPLLWRFRNIPVGRLKRIPQTIFHKSWISEMLVFLLLHSGDIKGVLCLSFTVFPTFPQHHMLCFDS